MKSNYKKSPSQVKVEYTSVYKKVSELRNIITQDITEKSKNALNQERELIEALDGLSKKQFDLALTSSYEKNASMAAFLEKLLNYIETSAKYLEFEDKQIGNRITVKKEEK